MVACSFRIHSDRNMLIHPARCRYGQERALVDFLEVPSLGARSSGSRNGAAPAQTPAPAPTPIPGGQAGKPLSQDLGQPAAAAANAAASMSSGRVVALLL